ncbi:unnamed protein product [Effrenium voratum]|nr:unnamed protein product [Effrenium voratum]
MCVWWLLDAIFFEVFQAPKETIHLFDRAPVVSVDLRSSPPAVCIPPTVSGSCNCMLCSPASVIMSHSSDKGHEEESRCESTQSCWPERLEVGPAQICCF